MKKFLLHLIFLFFLSCSSNDTILYKPISKDKLVTILIEMHTIDGIISSHNNYDERKIYADSSLYDSLIFKNYNINKTDFKKSIEYYTLQGSINAIYEQVIDTLNTRKVKIEHQRQILHRDPKQKHIK